MRIEPRSTFPLINVLSVVLLRPSAQKLNAATSASTRTPIATPALERTFGLLACIDSSLADQCSAIHSIEHTDSSVETLPGDKRLPPLINRYGPYSKRDTGRRVGLTCL